MQGSRANLAADIVVVGSINVDLTFETARIPKPGETVAGTQFGSVIGGKGANQAVACARLGSRTVLLAAVGEDANGEEALTKLREEGDYLELRTVQRLKQCATGVAAVLVEPAGENAIVVIPGANALLTANCLSEKTSQQALCVAAVVLCQLETPLNVALRAAQAGKANGALSILNPAPAQPLSAAELSAFDVLVPNTSELRLVAGLALDRPLEEAIDKLTQFTSVVVTLGAEGCAVRFVGQSETVFIAAEPTPGPVLDTTGAGDCFCGALSVHLSNLADPLDLEHLCQAARRAQKAAAISVTRKGAQAAMPRREEVGG